MIAVRPLDWIQEIERALIELEEKPQFGLPSLLNWEQLQHDLQKLLGHAELKLEHSMKGWTASNQLFSGLGNSLLTIAVDWTPLKNPVFFITDQQNLKELMSALFNSEEAANFFYDSSYVQGFYYYFSSELLRLLEKQQFSSPLTPRIGAEVEDIQKALGEESCFAIDISLAFGNKTFWGRILLSESFRKEWKTYFSHLGPPSLSEEMKEKLNVAVNLEVAHSRLALDEWKKVKAGDFILLDHCSYDPVEKKGSVVLTLQQKPIFRGRFKEGGIKITNYPIYEEVSDAMEEEPFSNNLEPEEDEDLYGDLDEEDEESEFEEDEDLFAGLEPKKEKAKEEERAHPPIAAKLAPSEEGVAISPEELPIHLTVEVGRVTMTAGSLMRLAPGSLLELNVSPEQGVDLVINGKKVGRGELIRMGDVLGVRILSL